MSVAFPRPLHVVLPFAARLARVSVNGDDMKFIASSSIAAALAAGLAFPFAANAQSELGPVVVTANRAPVPLSQTLSAVTVLTRDDIERSQAPDLLTLLARQPGIDIARTGGPGQASTVFLRGSNSGHALVLVDGVRINPATQGAPDFAHLPLLQVERIEVVRGPRAALWGSDAIGGVIQVFTRDPAQAYFEVKGGSYGRVDAGAGTGLARGEGRFGIALGQQRMQGFDATNARYPFGDYPDEDGYRNRHAVLRAGTLAGGQRLQLSALASNAFVEFDEGQTDAKTRVYALAVEGALGGGWSHALVLGRSTEDLRTPAFGSHFGSSRNTLDWSVSKSLGKAGTVDLGLNLSREAGYSWEDFTGGFAAARRNDAAFLAWRGRFGRQSWEASVRHDDNSQFGGASTGSLAWGWQAGSAWRLRASVGQGFRAPDFNALYYPGFQVAPGVVLFAGNPLLDPERSRSTEAGLDWTPSARTRLGLSIYRSRIDDLIVFAGPLSDALNIARADIDGAELEFSTRIGALALRAQAGWLDARDAGSGEPLPRRAPRKAALSADWGFGNGASAGIDFSAVAARPEVGDVRLGGYGRLDLRAMLPLAAGWRVEARLENLGDHDYQLVDGYATPGRSGMLGLRWDAE
jgi:vitamin B12 transporter